MASDSPAEKHSEVVDDITESFASTFGGGADVNDLSDDAFMQFVKNASERCGMAGIERDQRVDVIMAGIRGFVMERAEENLQDIRWQLELMFSL